MFGEKRRPTIVKWRGCAGRLGSLQSKLRACLLGIVGTPTQMPSLGAPLTKSQIVQTKKLPVAHPGQLEPQGRSAVHAEHHTW